MKFFKKIPYLTILSLGLLLASCSGSKKGYTITGTLPENLKMDSLYLMSYDNVKLQGVKVNQGKFEFKGETDNPAPASLFNDKANFNVGILLENDDIHINVISIDKPAEIKGGELYRTVYAFQENPEYQKLNNNYGSYSTELFSNLDKGDAEKVTKANKALNDYEARIIKLKDDELKKVIDGNNTPRAKLLAYTLMLLPGVPEDEMIAKLKEMSKAAGGSKYADYCIKFLEESKENKKNAQNVAVGKQYIDVTGKNESGKEEKLSQYVGKNKYTILEFWASWCAPCRSEIPNLKKAYAKYKSKGLEIVSYSIDEKHEAWIQATKEEKQPWINAIVPNAFKNADLKLYGVEGIPSSFLIDKDGKIVASNEELRDFNLDKTLSKFIK